jgi:hypothetical protein
MKSMKHEERNKMKIFNMALILAVILLWPGNLMAGQPGPAPERAASRHNVLSKSPRPKVDKMETPVSGGGAQSARESNRAKEKRKQVMVTTSVLPPMVRKVSVLVESEPSNSDIEVDGVYVGTTPVQLSLKEGVHHVRLAMPGYIPWERSVKAYNGLTVSPTLVHEEKIKRDITRTATSQ